MKTKITASISGLLVSLLTPLAILVPQVSAAPDACTWTGRGSPTVDSVNFTITYDISDPANWSVCNNGFVPEDGDSLEFPANYAQVDPGSTLTDDSQWKYVVDNTLPDETNIAGISFTGDTGTECLYGDSSLDLNNDRYFFTGNNIVMNGDINNDYTGDCYRDLATFLLQITLTGDSTLDINNGAQYLGSTYSSGAIVYGANQLTICDSTYSEVLNRFVDIDGLDGDGDVIANCSVTFGSDGSWSAGRNITANGYSLGVSSTAAIQSISLADNSSLNVNISGSDPYDEQEVTSDITFLGGPRVIDTGGGGVGKGGGGGTPTYTQTDKTPTSTTYPRMGVFYTSYDSDIQASIPEDVKFTGTITFSEDFEINHSANVNLAGPIVGAGNSISPRAGSSGVFKITSTENNSSSTGTFKTNYQILEIDGAYGDDSTGLYDLTVYGGNFTYLKTTESEAKDVNVQPYAKFGGLGTVQDLTVQQLAIYAPGLSPGCINSNNLTILGTYEVEIAGADPCTGYDQTAVTGAVDITGGTLDVTIADGFTPVLNQEFVIISNDAADAVTGDFSNYADGDRFDVAGVTYELSTDGGDGNDVTLTAVSAPAAVTAPDTGIGEILQNPGLAMLAVLMSAGALIGIRKLQTVKK